MKKLFLQILTTAALVLSLAGLAAAQVSDANKLGADVAMLNIESELPQGEKIITNRLLDDFNITTDTITSLIVRNMKYGDIAAILAFAETLPGGMSNDSINEVTILRERGVQWDQAAAILVNRYNINVSDVAVTVSRIEDDAHNSIEFAIAESLGAAGSAAGGAGQPEAGAGGTGSAAGGGQSGGGAAGGTGSAGSAPGGSSGGTGGR